MPFHQPGEQLKLFYRPQEIMDRVNHSYDTHETESLDRMWQRKTAESKQPYGTPSKEWSGEMAHGAGIFDSIKEHGVTSHVQIADEDRRTYLLDGHHRVAAAAAVERETGREMHVPVLHGEAVVTTKSNGFYSADAYWPQNMNRKWDG